LAQKPAQKGTIINILNNLTSVNESISCPMSVNGEPEKDFVSKILPKTFNLELANPIQTMTLEDGSVYGFVNNGKIYLNPDLMNSKDAVHEYTHLWDAYTRRQILNSGIKDLKFSKTQNTGMK